MATDRDDQGRFTSTQTEADVAKDAADFAAFQAIEAKAAALEQCDANGQRHDRGCLDDHAAPPALAFTYAAARRFTHGQPRV